MVHLPTVNVSDKYTLLSFGSLPLFLLWHVNHQYSNNTVFAIFRNAMLADRCLYLIDLVSAEVSSTSPISKESRSLHAISPTSSDHALLAAVADDHRVHNTAENAFHCT